MNSRPADGIMSLAPQPLTDAAFAPFGDVISRREAGGIPSNQGTAIRFEKLSELDVGASGGSACATLYHVQPARFPFRFHRLEQHPLSTQMFVPMSGRPFLVIVSGDSGGHPDPQRLHAFLTDGNQAINYHRGTWHHPVIALGQAASFVMIGRQGPGDNLRIEPFPKGAAAEVMAV